MKKPATATRRNGTVRCAIYTRKSSEEGLEQEFNSLQAQREACEAFIESQRQEGWVCLRAAYDDGGFSGATMDRPALQRLLADLTAGRVDTIVVYKIDRLTRSLADFAKIVEILDAKGASFVSVTQQFNTTTSMGRLTLNILLSFAQFEREVIGERIRDKIAASKRKGMWMGGVPPLGYRVRDRRLVIVDGEAEIVRTIFRRYAELGSVRGVEGGARGPRDQKQVVDERLGSPDRRQAILARCALPDAAGPPLSRRDRSQGTIPPRRTPANHRSAAVEYGSGAACRLAEDEGCAAGKATHRPTSSCDCSFFLCLAASRTRASAWVTRSRLCVRCVLCWSAFPLVPGLGSANSATSRPALFIGFIATMPESDFSGSCISGFGSSPSRYGPSDHSNVYGQSRDLPVPAQGASVHARVSDHAGSSEHSQ